MSFQLIAAIIIISLALVFYTIGVFMERKEGTLTLKHLVLFLIGLACDTTGTTIMTNIASSSQVASSQGVQFHAITGGLAILLMLFHALWAAFVLFKGNESAKKKFHAFSGLVWTFWLIPYICGLLFAGMHLNAELSLVLAVAIAFVLWFFLVRRPKTQVTA